MALRPLLPFNYHLSKISCFIRHHQILASILFLLFILLVVLIIMIQFAYDQLTPPIFILFNDNELNPNVSAIQSRYNLDEIMEFD